MIHEYTDFKAVHDLMPGSGLPLRVDGGCVFTTTGFKAHLREAAGNTGPGLQMLTLDLVIEEPPPGTSVAEVLTPVAVHFEDDIDVRYQEVEFRIQGSADEPPAPVPVKELH